MASIEKHSVGDRLRGQWYRAPQFATAIENGDNVVKAMAAAHDKLRTGFDSVVKARNTPDPTKTEDGHFMEVYARAERWRESIAGELSRARETAEAEIAKLDNEIVEKLAIKDGEYGSELRAHFKSLSPNDRIKEIETAIEKFDAMTMGAILSAPARLSGLTDEQKDMFRRRYAEKHVPNTIARKAVIADALATNSQGFDEALIGLGKLCPKSRYEAIRARQLEAQAAKDGIAA